MPNASKYLPRSPQAGASMVVKVGVDAINIGVIDIWWTSDGALRRRVSLLPCEEYAPHPEVQALVYAS